MNYREKVIENYQEYCSLINNHTNLVAEISQNLYEMADVIEYLDNRKFNNFLEIGSCVGGSLYIYGNLLCSDTANITSIDIDGRKEIEIVLENFKNKKTNLIKNSSANIIDKDLNFPFDLVHIDGDHDAIAVPRDFNLIYPLVETNGVIIFHDVFEHQTVFEFTKKLEESGENIKFFKELTYPKFGVPSRLGIGVLIKSGEKNESGISGNLG